jgi:hypothetical protein
VENEKEFGTTSESRCRFKLLGREQAPQAAKFAQIDLVLVV